MAPSSRLSGRAAPAAVTPPSSSSSSTFWPLPVPFVPPACLVLAAIVSVVSVSASSSSYCVDSPYIRRRPAAFIPPLPTTTMMTMTTTTTMTMTTTGQRHSRRWRQRRRRCGIGSRLTSSFRRRHDTGRVVYHDDNVNDDDKDDVAAAASSTSLFGGKGVAANYTWREEQYEIDVTVTVPGWTRTSDVIFRATPRSVDLRLSTSRGTGVRGKGSSGDDDDDDDDDNNEIVLLDGNRPMRGRVAVDGTYWSLSDREGEDVDGDGGGGGGMAEVASHRDGRQVTVTIEKMIREPTDQFEVVEFDWGGVYPDDKDEVMERTYDEPKELDVREYCRSLGVDIDNINMTMVDKTMFTSGLNMSRSALDELSNAGYVKEVTQQDFGKEYVTDKDGNAVPFSSLGENVGEDEIRDAMLANDGAGGGNGRENAVRSAAAAAAAGGTKKGGIRDRLNDIVGSGSSPWGESMPAVEARIDDEGGYFRGADVDAGAGAEGEADTDADVDADKDAAVDPIDLLTVKRLRDILKEQGLKVSGNKQELRDRLREHVNFILEDMS